MKTRRRPKRSAARPPSIRNPAKVERVGVHHPLLAGHRKPQAVAHLGQGHIDDGHVEHDHELGDAADDQDCPGREVACSVVRWSTTQLLVARICLRLRYWTLRH